MKWLRRHATVFIWLTAIAFVIWMFALWGMDAFQGNRSQSIPMVSVNGTTIYYGDFQERLSQRRRQLAQESDTSPTSGDLDQLRQEVLRDMIRETVLQKTVNKGGFEADKEQLELMLSAQLAGGENVNPEQLDGVLDRLPKEQRTTLLSQQRKQVESITQRQWLTHQIPESPLIDDLLRDGILEVRAWGIYQDPHQFVEEERIQKFYESYKEDRFLKEPEARIREIFLGNPQEADDPEAAFSELEETTEILNQKLQSGESFTELAQQYNQDEELAQTGGDLGWITKDDLPNRQARRIFNADPGEHTSMVRTDEGYHYYYLETGPRSEAKPLEEVRDQITEELLSEDHWQQARKRLVEFREQVQSANNPRKRIQQLAAQHSHSPVQSRNGDYGWIPKRYFVVDRHAEKSSWLDELADDQVLYPSLRDSLFTDPHEPGLRQPVQSASGYHLFYAGQLRQPEPSDLSQSTRQTWRQRLTQNHRDQYTEAWLRWKLEQANITDERPEQIPRDVEIPSFGEDEET